MSIDALERLRAIVAQTATGELDEELALWLHLVVRRYLHARRFGCSFERAAGLDDGRGIAWWHEFAIASRNEQIRAIAQEHFGNLRLTGQAEAIAREVARYESVAWRRDRDRGGPGETADQLRQRLFALLRAGEVAERSVPRSARQLQNILREKVRK